jgi:hypothetical protein
MVVERKHLCETLLVDRPGSARCSAQDDFFGFVTVPAEVNDVRPVLQQELLNIDWLNCCVLE